MLITITGASGSGKSYISEFLCSLDKNIVHLNIDEVGHEVLDMPEIKKMISEKFNLKINEEKINRKKLGDLVFNNHQKMKQLSDITWEAMENIIDSFIEENKNKIIILDWILMPKTKYFNDSNINILVQADLSSRMKRAILRDKINKEKFKEREKATLDFTRNNFNYIIKNNDIKQTRKEVKKIYDESIISR